MEKHIWIFLFYCVQLSDPSIHPSIRRSVFSFVSAGLFCWSVCLLVHLVRTCIISGHSWKVWCSQVSLGEDLAWLLLMRGPPCLLGAEGRLWVRLAGTVSFIIAYQHHLPGLTWYDPPVLFLVLEPGIIPGVYDIDIVFLSFPFLLFACQGQRSLLG